MGKRKEGSKKWLIWLGWVLAGMAGYAAGIAVCLLIPTAISETATSLLLGVIIGAVQWLLLRHLFRRAGWWILASALGIPLGFAVTRLITWSGRISLAEMLFFGLTGLALGTAQWLFLRRRARRSGWWILASTASWVAGGYGIWLVNTLQLVEFYAILATYTLLGLVFGALTGAVLALLKERPEAAEAKKGMRAWEIVLACCALTGIVTAVVSESRGMRLGDVPEMTSMPVCENLPALECSGDEAYCGEVVAFEPIYGEGYVNYPANGETWDDQYRSYLRRDLMMAVKYAAAKVKCLTEDWDSAPYQVLGLGDMSEADGSIPGTSMGSPAHPEGTHTDGHDIDVGYFQLETRLPWLKIGTGTGGIEGNLLGLVCKSTNFGVNVDHCTEFPILLDPWRTALFIAIMAEHPNLRVIGVDGQVGPVIGEVLERLAQAGWISEELRGEIPYSYETVYEGWGWYLYHNHHMHISINE